MFIMMFLLLCGLVTSYSFPKDNEFTPGQTQKEFVYVINKNDGSASKNSEDKDNSEANVTHLDLSQALKSQESSREEAPGISHNRNASLATQKPNFIPRQ